jgi:hypothetical protein
MVRSIVCWRPVREDGHHPNLKTLEIGLFPHDILQKVSRSAPFAASAVGSRCAAVSSICSGYHTHTVNHSSLHGSLPVENRVERVFVMA